MSAGKITVHNVQEVAHELYYGILCWCLLNVPTYKFFPAGCLEALLKGWALAGDNDGCSHIPLLSGTRCQDHTLSILYLLYLKIAILGPMFQFQRTIDG